jgi:excisionase family DNA binding protein
VAKRIEELRGQLVVAATPPPLEQSRLLSYAEAAAHIGVAPQTLYNMRTAGTAPPAVRIGRLVRYRHADLDEWVNGRAASHHPKSD